METPSKANTQPDKPVHIDFSRSKATLDQIGDICEAYKLKEVNKFTENYTILMATPKGDFDLLELLIAVIGIKKNGSKSHKLLRKQSSAEPEAAL